MQVSTWDASQLAMSLGNILVDSGFGENTIGKLQVDQKYWTVHKGQDGSVTRAKVLAKVARFTFTLQQASVFNDQLSALSILDHSTPGGAGMSAFQLKDLNGTTLVTAAHAFIEGPPEQVEFAAEAKDREWTVVLMDASVFLGGNIPQ